MASSAPVVLSTPAEHIFEDSTPAVSVPEVRLSDEQLYLQYEIKRTVSEIQEGRWKRIALQFPDEMLVDAPRVFERLREDFKAERVRVRQFKGSGNGVKVDDVTEGLKDAQLGDVASVDENRTVEQPAGSSESGEDVEERLCILADTSYGTCCVDEIAAEHMDADVVVHYGRSCLSPTARLPVIYVFTAKPLDLDAAVASFKQMYPEKDEKVCLMADIPYHHHLPALVERVRAEGYTKIYETEIVHDPSSLLPNRTVPPDVKTNPEKHKEYSIFHMSSPPTSLLLILSSRVKTINILSTNTPGIPSVAAASTSHLLRRRYALLTRLATVPIFGILINTLSVRNYMAALQHCQDLISRAGKKSYVFVVGKVNAAKLANFSEIGGWVVIGCWESSLVGSTDFYRPIITPFELEVALMEDRERVWGGQWVGDFGALIGREGEAARGGDVWEEGKARAEEVVGSVAEGNWDDQPSDDEPPDFDLRTGRYVSHSRPMGRPKKSTTTSTPTLTNAPNAPAGNLSSTPADPASSALIPRAPSSLTTTINGALSPAAEFLRAKRTWQGLGSDYEIAYERDEEGRIRGAGMEEGRKGVARGYAVGEGGVRS